MSRGPEFEPPSDASVSPEQPSSEPGERPNFEPPDYSPRRGSQSAEEAGPAQAAWEPERLLPAEAGTASEATPDQEPMPRVDAPEQLVDDGLRWSTDPDSAVGGAAASAPEPEPSPQQEGTPRLVRTLRLVGAILAVLAVAGVWFAGGFATQVAIRWVEPGTEMDAHDLVYTLDHATARLDASGWTVQVYGTVSNPNLESLAPEIGTYGSLALRFRKGTDVANLQSFELGDGYSRRYISPGDQVGLIGTFSLPAELTPGDTVEVTVIPREFTNTSILELTDQAVWNTDSHAEILATRLPLAVLEPGA